MVQKTNLTPHLESPKCIATKMGEATYETELYHYAEFHTNQWQRRRDSCPQPKKKQCYRFSIRQNAY